MKVTKSLIRGGQLVMHSLRMLRQVFLLLVKWGIVSIFLSSVSFCCFKLSLYQLRILFCYYLAILANSLGNPDGIITIVNRSGSPFTMRTADVVANVYVKSISSHVLEVLSHALIFASCITAVLTVFLLFVFFKRGTDISKDEEIRGQELTDCKVLEGAIKKHNAKLKYKGYRLASIPYPAHTETMHTLITGSTGSGKTVLISDIVSQIKARGDKAIIYDKMGTYTERFYDKSKDVILNPFESCSPTWSIFKEVRQAANFDSIAAAFIPMEKSNNDPFWVRAARTLFAEVCSSLLESGGTTNKGLVDILLKKSLNEAAALVKGTAAQAIIDEQSPKTALSVMSMLATYLKSLKYLKDGDDTFSISDWVNDEDNSGCIFIPSSGELHSTLMPLISAWIEIALNNILSLKRSRDRKIWIILDELPSLHTLPSLQQGLAEVRQFGGCFVLSIQSISQLRERYGFNGAQTISSLCNTRVYLRAGDSDSARWYSENIGMLEVEEFREGLSYGAHETRDGVSVNKQRTIKHLVLPSQIICLKSMEGYFSMAGNFPTAKVEFEYKDWPIIYKESIGADALQAPLDKDRTAQQQNISLLKTELKEAHEEDEESDFLEQLLKD